MLHRILSSSRYIVLIAVLGTFIGSLMLMIYEGVVVAVSLADAVASGSFSAKDTKTLAVGLIEAVDVFLISIAVYIISLSLYALFVDETLPMPKWMEVNNLEDLKANLVSVVIAVLAVLFLREAVSWDGERGILELGASMAIVIAALTFYLRKDGRRGE
jgi:uncharacterized membrane protein YqhA